MKPREVFFVIAFILAGILTIFFNINSNPKNQIKQKLLYQGGSSVEDADEEWIYTELLNHGRWFDDPLILIEMEIDRCYENCVHLIRDEGYNGSICVGYALFEDRWWYHAWILTPNSTIIETTMIMEAYFGYIVR